jgi:Ribosomal L22e protein family
MAPSRKAVPAKAAKARTFTIDCSKPVDDKIMDLASFEKFLTEKIKASRPSRPGMRCGEQGAHSAWDACCSHDCMLAYAAL